MASLAHGGRCEEKIIEQVAHKQQAFLSHKSGGCESKIMAPAEWVSHDGLHLDLYIDGHLFTVCSHGRAGEGALWDLFYRSTNPIHEAPLSSCDLITSKKAHLLISSHGKLGFNI